VIRAAVIRERDVDRNAAGHTLVRGQCADRVPLHHTQVAARYQGEDRAVVRGVVAQVEIESKVLRRFVAFHVQALAPSTVNTSTWCQVLVKLGSTCGQDGVNLGSSWGQAGVNLHRPTEVMSLLLPSSKKSITVMVDDRGLLMGVALAGSPLRVIRELVGTAVTSEARGSATLTDPKPV